MAKVPGGVQVLIRSVVCLGSSGSSYCFGEARGSFLGSGSEAASWGSAFGWGSARVSRGGVSVSVSCCCGAVIGVVVEVYRRVHRRILALGEADGEAGAARGTCRLRGTRATGLAAVGLRYSVWRPQVELR